MKKPITPGRLALYAVGILVAWIVFAVVLAFAVEPSTPFVRLAGYVVFAVVGILLVMAAIAKAVQIGVRSSRE